MDQLNKGLAWNAERATVESGLIKHHMVPMEPANPAALDVAALDGLKFDVSSGFNTAQITIDLCLCSSAKCSCKLQLHHN